MNRLALIAALLLFPIAEAGASVWSGNDTGGIIAWTLAGQTDARQLAIDHCARYGKLMKPLAAQRNYGGYISFACVWPRPVRSVQVLRVSY